jgi:hypothetical protein
MRLFVPVINLAPAFKLLKKVPMKKMGRIECTVKAISDEHADYIFRLASQRLLHVYRWSMLKDCLLPSSEQRNIYGVAVERVVCAGDYINLTHSDLRPFGWMEVEKVSNGTEGRGEVALMARPVAALHEMRATEQIPLTVPVMFRIMKKGLEVTASFIMESNPLPGAAFERLGIYCVQWRSLVNGVLSDLHPVEERVAVDA